MKIQLRGKRMVKINISIEGEDLSDIVSELLKIGTIMIRSNRRKIREFMEILADESIDVLMECNIIKKGAKLYRNQQ